MDSPVCPQLNADDLWSVMLEQDLNATKADRKHKNKISYAEFSVAIKGVLLGMLAGSKYKKVKEMNPVLEEAIVKLEKAGFKPGVPKKGKGGDGKPPPPPLGRALTFKAEMTDREKEAMLILYEEQTARAMRAEEEAKKAAAEVAAADEAAKEAAEAKASKLAEEAAAQKAAQEAQKPQWVKGADGNWTMESQDDVDKRIAASAPVEEPKPSQEELEAARQKASILDAAEGDPEMAAKIEKKMEEARLALEARQKQKAEAAMAATAHAEQDAKEAKAKEEIAAKVRAKKADEEMKRLKAEKAAAKEQESASPAAG